MVDNSRNISKITKMLEAYYIAKSGFNLTGENYDLILIVPSESSGLMKNSWIISGKLLQYEPETKVVSEIFEFFKQTLSMQEYSSISRINIISNQHYLVKYINQVAPWSFKSFKFLDQKIDGFDLSLCTVIRSQILKKLRDGCAMTFILNNGKKVVAGIISINDKYDIKHYTGKGLTDLFGNSGFKSSDVDLIRNKNDEFLIANNYISFTNFKDIKDIL